ncbi:UTP--glucose-1-phosphate uridylyltransferase [Paenibacillus sp. 2TAB19]|uniref:UTP--glucose-1-phosphate uridylyltransferase n=1 Tax=Paenibacillus sp. 2TAB19 TaxID=3233003 RepID=UPI003F9A724E
MDHLLQQAEAVLIQHKQEHVLHVMKSLDTPKRERLCEQVLRADLDRLKKIVNQHRASDNDDMGMIAPIAYKEWDSFGEAERDDYIQLGLEQLQNGKIAALVVAGGHGSRLGHDGPKGTIDIGLPSGKSLFELQADRLAELSRRTGVTIPWYIMTSPDNDAETRAFFEEAGFFGYPKQDCCFFQQHTMPAVDYSGKLLFSSESELNFAPSGNGECFSSLRSSGALEDMKRRGIQWVFYYNVDNALIQIADPAFIGVVVAGGHPIATKVVERTNPDEKIGILCMRNGRPAVVEYTEVPQAMLESRELDGSLTYHLGNISIHLFRLDFIEKHADTDLPYHVAKKKIDYVDAEGRYVEPTEPNAYKLERFIFDFFPMSDGMTVLKAGREGEFAPVKNKEGEDSPASARELVLRAQAAVEAQRGASSLASELTFVNGPYLQWPTERGMTMMWETSQPASGKLEIYAANRIHSGERGNYVLHDHPMMTVHSEEGSHRRIQRLTVDGLTPGTTYFYKAYADSAEGRSVEEGPHPFRIAAPGGVPFSFVVTSETGGYHYFDQSGGDINRSLFSQMSKYRPDFALFVGDMVDDGRRQEDWHTYLFGPGKELLAATPFYSCLGNHEYQSSWFYDYSAYPHPGNYYSFNYGDAHFIALDSTDFIKDDFYPDGDGSIGPGHAQYDFLERDLQAAAENKALKWRIVFIHYSPFVSGGYEVEALRKLAPVMEKYGVDVVFSSHTIVYERSHPLREGKLDFDNGIVYVVAGGAGAMPSWQLPKREWHTSQSLAVPHFVQVTAAGDCLDLRAIDIEGRLFDTLKIRKGSGGAKQFI